jgi:hypothetical protein
MTGARGPTIESGNAGKSSSLGVLLCAAEAMEMPIATRSTPVCAMEIAEAPRVEKSGND